MSVDGAVVSDWRKVRVPCPTCGTIVGQAGLASHRRVCGPPVKPKAFSLLAMKAPQRGACGFCGQRSHWDGCPEVSA